MGQLLEGRVLTVDPAAGTLTVALESTARTIAGVRMQRNNHPARGDLVTIAKSSAPDGPWYCLTEPYEMGAGAPELLEGAKGLVSRSGSSIVIHPNGDIVFADNAMTRLSLIPARRLLELSLLRWRLVSPHGSIIWEPEIFNVNVGAGGQTAKLFLGTAGEVFGAGNWAASRALGAALTIGASFHTEIAEDGGISMVAKDVNLEATDVTRVKLGESATLQTKNVEWDGAGSDYRVRAGTLDVRLETTCALDGKTVRLTGTRIELDDADGPAVDGAKLLQWFAKDFKVVSGMLSPDALAALPNVLSKKVFL